METETPEGVAVPFESDYHEHNPKVYAREYRMDYCIYHFGGFDCS